MKRRYPYPVRAYRSRKMTTAQKERATRNYLIARAKRRAARSNRIVGGDSIGNVKVKYVDGYYDSTDIHEFDADANDSWTDTEANPRQQTAVYGCLPVPAVGDGYSNRDDRRIKILKIKIKGYINFPGELGLTQDTEGGKFVRIVIVKDSRTGGQTLQGEDVIGPGKGSDNQATVSGTGGAINFFTNPNGWGRYQVMKDFLIKKPYESSFYDGTDGNSNGVQVPFKITIKPNCIVNFSGTTGAIGSVVDNSFHLLCGCDIDNQVAPKLSYYARTTFIDA